MIRDTIGIVVGVSCWIIFLIMPFGILLYFMISGKLGELTGHQ